VFVCEGIATGLSVHDQWIENGEPEAPGEYVNQCTTLALMDGGNAIRQARAIRERYHNRKLIIVSDDDGKGREVAGACLESGFDGAWRVSACGLGA
jgi:phage/plasmid primase-like uncharacterized protein